LHSQDDVWKYWILANLVRTSASLSKGLHNELRRIASSPSAGERTEGVDELAIEILNARNL